MIHFKRPVINRRRLVSSLTGLVVSLVLLFMGLSLLTYGAYYFIHRYQVMHRRPLPTTNVVVTHTSRSPGEAPVPTSIKDDYPVDADQPRLVTLPTIQAAGFIQQVGVDTALHEIATPTNVNLTGWYTRSVRPGDPGVSLILGHVQGVYSPGVFKHLAGLKSKDAFTVSYGDGSVRKFEVVSVTNYTPSDATDRMLEPVAGIEAQLNLITCGGNYDRAAHEYDRRTIVVSKRIE